MSLNDVKLWWLRRRIGAIDMELNRMEWEIRYLRVTSGELKMRVNELELVTAFERSRGRQQP